MHEDCANPNPPGHTNTVSFDPAEPLLHLAPLEPDSNDRVPPGLSEHITLAPLAALPYSASSTTADMLPTLVSIRGSAP